MIAAWHTSRYLEVVVTDSVAGIVLLPVFRIVVAKHVNVTSSPEKAGIQITLVLLRRAQTSP